MNPRPDPVGPTGDRLFTREQAAERLNVTPRFVTRCVQERRIRFVRVGRMVRIPEAALDEYIASNTVNPRVPQRIATTIDERRAG
jgi:excisionase family DNA binding protein